MNDVNDKEIIFSKSIKAGKRIYYLDVKKNRKNEMFLAITESKKIISGESNEPQISFEKHKIFLYREDFEKFITGLNEAIQFINANQNSPISETSDSFKTLPATDAKNDKESNEIKIDIEF